MLKSFLKLLAHFRYSSVSLSQTSFEARILLSQNLFYAQKNLKGFFTSRCLIFKVRSLLSMFGSLSSTRECLNIISSLISFVNKFFANFQRFFNPPGCFAFFRFKEQLFDIPFALSCRQRDRIISPLFANVNT